MTRWPLLDAHCDRNALWRAAQLLAAAHADDGAELLAQLWPQEGRWTVTLASDGPADAPVRAYCADAAWELPSEVADRLMTGLEDSLDEWLAEREAAERAGREEPDWDDAARWTGED